MKHEATTINLRDNVPESAPHGPRSEALKSRPAARSSDTDEPTRRVSVTIPESAYEQLRTAAIRLGQNNSDIVVQALTEYVSRRAFAPLEGHERERLRRRGEMTPEQQAEWEEEQQFAEELWATLAEEGDAEDFSVMTLTSSLD